MLEERIVYFNGDFIPWNRATVHTMSHGFARGSGIFEVMSLHETASGPAVFRLDDHVGRLAKTAEVLDMELPLSVSRIKEAVFNTIRRNKARQGLIKIMGFHSQVSFGLLPPPHKLDLSIFVIDPEKDLDSVIYPQASGVSLCISTWKKLSPETVPIEAKVTANYLNGMMAGAEARRRGFDNAVMLDTEGYIAEGGTDSVFLVKENSLMTPALGTVLDSITRRSVIELAGALGIKVIEGRFPPGLLYEAEEIFLSGTPMKILPVRCLDDRMMGVTPGPTTGRLAEFMKRILGGEQNRFWEWLFVVK